MKKIITMSFLVISINTLTSVGSAYEKKVHRQITESSIPQSNLISYLSDNFKIKETDTFKGFNSKKWIINGSAFEDGEYEGGPKWLENLISATVEKARYKNHFYDPTTGSGLNDTVQGYTLTGLPSLEWGKDSSGNDYSWKKARLYFLEALTNSESGKREEYFALLFRSLGQVMHLLQDKSVPAHVRNDSHGLELNGYDMYEKYTESNTLTYTGYPVVDLTTFNTINNFWDTNTGLGLAEFTNTNFLSRDTNIDNNKYSLPVSIGYSITTERVYDPYYNWWTDVEVKYLQGYATDKYRPETSKPIARLSAISFFDYEVNRYFGKNIFSLNKFIHKEYADFLIPRAVGYSAGLLNYFFRGQMDMYEDPDNLGTFIIENKTGETMEGEFRLFYDDKNGNRSEITGAAWSLDDIPVELAASGDGSKKKGVTFTPPSPKPEGDKYMLVFYGKIGHENDVPVGKIADLRNTPVFKIKLTRADGVVITPQSVNWTEIIIYDSEDNWAGDGYQFGADSYNLRYDEKNGLWVVKLDPTYKEPSGNKGFWVDYYTDNSIFTQYPGRYKSLDKRKEEDLIQPGSYVDNIPLWDDTKPMEETWTTTTYIAKKDIKSSVPYKTVYSIVPEIFPKWQGYDCDNMCNCTLNPSSYISPGYAGDSAYSAVASAQVTYTEGVFSVQAKWPLFGDAIRPTETSLGNENLPAISGATYEINVEWTGGKLPWQCNSIKTYQMPLYSMNNLVKHVYYDGYQWRYTNLLRGLKAGSTVTIGFVYEWD